MNGCANVAGDDDMKNLVACLKHQLSCYYLQSSTFFKTFHGVWAETIGCKFYRDC